MSKKSTAALSVLPVQPLARLSKPDGLTSAEAELWTAVVDSKPAEWFGEDSAPLLLEYVRCAAMTDCLDALVKASLIDPESDLNDALKMRDRESKRLAALATKLRLTQQSRYTPQAASTANKKAAGARPWQG